MNENEVKVFSLEEANSLIPLLTELIRKLHEKREEAVGIEVQIDALELVSGHENGTAAQEKERLMAKHRRLVGEFYEMVDEIHSHGCFLKDADLGLIDFYGIVEGHVVYLCWRLGEERVAFWHEISQGYAARQPL